ncbi:MAG: hypothetical protein PHV53_03170 [Fermentimonas sp.]|nr:hypothetical protein [Fermentimonas sp.]
MKRIIAIFSLIIMSIAAIQPVIAMHYCDDELRSLQIYQTNGIQDSCCDDTENHDLLISGDFCCETEMLELSTDEYQTKAEEPAVRISPLSIDIYGITPVNLQFESDPDSDSILTTLKFPTKGLYLEDVSILTYICIYRI